MDDDEGMIFFGGGSLHSIREEDHAPRSHLDRLHSMSDAARAAFAPRPESAPNRRKIGFHIPKRKK